MADELITVDANAAHARQAVTDLGHSRGDITEDQPAEGLHRLRVPGLDVAAAVRQARASNADTVVGPNHVFLSAPHEVGGPFGPPSAAARTGLLAAHPATDNPIRVTVLDTGVWADSPLPADRYLAGTDAHESTLDANQDGSIDSDVGHANFIAGVILQRTPHAQVRIIKLLDSFGVCTEVQLAAAIATLTDVDVLNLSLGGFTMHDQPPAVLGHALRQFLHPGGRIVVAAAGNDGSPDRPFWPAAFAATDEPWAEDVVAVAANNGPALTEWTNSGPWVSLSAPGADVLSTYVRCAGFGTGWAVWNGTSFAVPHVVAALVEQAVITGSVPKAAQMVLAAAGRETIDGLPAMH